MKAVLFTKYGSPDVLELQEVEKPVPLDGEVLIRIRATSVNDWDVGIITGKPLFMRWWYGFRKPKPAIRIIGCDVAGIVETVGNRVTRFKVGDSVYGDLHASGFGAYAEYVCANVNHLALKPQALSFEQAGATPHSATLAWQGLHGIVELRDGLNVLINGAGGGVGPIALQLLKQHDIEVTGVDNASKLELMQSVGFDHVIDYQKEDFTRSGKRYDVIFDTKTCYFPTHYLRALRPNGSYITVGGSTPKLLSTAILSRLIKRLSGKQFRLIGLRAAQGLEEMAPLFESGILKPVVDGPFELPQAADALRYYLSGTQKGRIVITVSTG